MTARKVIVLLCGLAPLLSLAGCGARDREPARLVLISPHRDEIREEVGGAFRDWFRARTEARAAAAAAALRAWLDRPDATRRGDAERALEHFLSDWRPDDLSELGAAVAAWKEPGEAGAEHARVLLDLLARWQTAPRPIDVVWVDLGGGTSQIVRYIQARFDTNPEGIGIDLLFGGGTDVFVGLARANRLQPLDRETPNAAELRQLLAPERIPAQLHGVPLYDPGGRWFGPIVSSFGILYNREVLRRVGQPEPGHWADLGAPGLRSWVSAGDPRLTGSLHMVYEIILQSHGWDEGFALLMRLGANTQSFIRDSGSLTRAVTNGEVAAAGTVDANALSAVGRNPGLVGYVIPSGETVINADAVAVLKGAPRPQLAWAFVEFTLSDAGQKIFLLQPGQPGGPRRYPLCRLGVVQRLYEEYPEAARSVGSVNPFAPSKSFSYNNDLATKRWDALNDLFGAVILDAQPELSAAWQAVLSGRAHPQTRERLAGELFRPFVSASELDDYVAAVRAAGPRYRTEAVNRWGEQARERYRRVRREADR